MTWDRTAFLAMINLPREAYCASYVRTHNMSHEQFALLINNLCDDARADGEAAFANSEAAALFQCYRRD